MTQQDALPALALQHQQVFAFVSSYLRTSGCLPTAREAALACGFRSPTTAGRLVADLEEIGLLRRDPQHPRLASIPAWADVSPIALDEQLWWCERECIEHEAGLKALQVGLSLAPNLNAVAALHAEGSSRVTVLLACQDTCGYLRAAGATLTPDGRAALDEQAEVAQAANTLLTDWDAYCVVRLVWALSAREGLAQLRPMELGYFGGSVVAELRVTESLLPGYSADAEALLAQGGADPLLLSHVADLLGRLRRGAARQYPSRLASWELDIPRLLAGRP